MSQLVFLNSVLIVFSIYLHNLNYINRQTKTNKVIKNPHAQINHVASGASAWLGVPSALHFACRVLHLRLSAVRARAHNGPPLISDEQRY